MRQGNLMGSLALTSDYPSGRTPMLSSNASRFLLSFTVAIIISCSAAAQQNPGTLAVVNGSAITTQDLQQKEVNHLLQAQYQYYQAERKALDDLIVQRLLEGEAESRGI